MVFFLGRKGACDREREREMIMVEGDEVGRMVLIYIYKYTNCLYKCKKKRFSFQQ